MDESGGSKPIDFESEKEILKEKLHGTTAARKAGGTKILVDKIIGEGRGEKPKEEEPVWQPPKVKSVLDRLGKTGTNN